MLLLKRQNNFFQFKLIKHHNCSKQEQLPCTYQWESYINYCYSQQLSLVVAASCSIQCVRNALDQIKEHSFFFNFFKPGQNMLGISTENHALDCMKKKLKNICCTRCVEEIIGLDNFEHLFFYLCFIQNPRVSIGGGFVARRLLQRHHLSINWLYKLLFIG